MTAAKTRAELVEIVGRAIVDQIITDRVTTGTDIGGWAIDALRAAGYAVVPVKPTEAMIGAVQAVLPTFFNDDDLRDIAAAPILAMIAAASTEDR